MIKKFIREIEYGNRLTDIIRILLGLLFVYSGIFKILKPVEFGEVITRYDLLPPLLVPYAALIISYLEVVTGVLLTAGYRIKPASLLLMGLVSVFTAAILISVARGLSFDCGCFETGRFGLSEEVSLTLAVRDLVILGALLLVYRAKNHGISLDGLREKKDLKEF